MEIDWDQKVMGVKIGIKSSHLGCCGLGGISQFSAVAFPSSAMCWTHEEVVRKYEMEREWRNYSGALTPQGAMRIGRALIPQSILNKYTQTDWNRCRGPKTFATTFLTVRKRLSDNMPTLYDSIRKVAEEVDQWCTSSYRMIIFSGCCSPLVPRTEGKGVYDKVFDANVFAEWIKKSGCGALIEGPIAYNSNHGSMVRVWSWIPPWVGGIRKNVAAYMTPEDAEAEIPIPVSRGE